MKHRKLLIGGIALIAAIPARASVDNNANSFVDQQIEAKSLATKVTYIDGRPSYSTEQKLDLDSIRKVVTRYYYDQFRNSQNPDMPYFLFMSKGAKLTLGIGGGVRMRAYFDWNGAMPSSAFAPYTIPIPTDPARKSNFNSTPAGTYLNFTMIGHNSIIGDYGLYIEADFTGYGSRDFHLKKSYAMIRDFTLGYATSTFSDPAAQPAILDAAGANNKYSNTSVLVRYMPCIKDKWYLAASIETPATALDVTNGLVKEATNWVPDAAAFVQYEWKKGQHVRLSGIVRSLSYLTLADLKQHNMVGWGVQGSGVYRPHQQITLYGTVNCGEGYGGLGGDLLYGAYDLVPDPKNPSELYAPFSYGWCGGVQYNILPNLFTTLAASQTRYMPKDGMEPDEYKYGIFSCANVFWSILPRLTVAAEYDWGMRKNFSGAHKAASRLNFSAIFSF